MHRIREDTSRDKKSGSAGTPAATAGTPATAPAKVPLATGISVKAETLAYEGKPCSKAKGGQLCR
jgi:hypothetical protein